MKKNSFNKILALLLVIVMVIPCVPVIATAADTTGLTKLTAENTVYEPLKVLSDENMTAVEKVAAFKDSRQINTVEDLACFMVLGAQSNAEKFQPSTILLKSDLKVNGDIVVDKNGDMWVSPDSTLWNEGKYTVYTWTPYGINDTTGTQFGYFRGKFDGGNKAISGLYIDDRYTYAVSENTDGSYSYTNNTDISDESIGFFAYVGNGNSKKTVDIKNITFSNCVVMRSQDSTAGTGLLVGKVRTTHNTDILSISNVNVNNSYVESKRYVGGLIGRCFDMTMSDCTIDISINCTNGAAYSGNAGGLIGAVVGSSESALANVNISNVDISLNFVAKPRAIGGVIGECSSFSEVELDGVVLKGALTATPTLNDTDKKDNIGTFVSIVNATSGKLTLKNCVSYAEVRVNGNLKTNFVGTGSATITNSGVLSYDSSWYNGGKGDSNGEFIISTPNQLAYFMELGQSGVNFSGKTVKLGNDIVWNEGTATENGFTSDGYVFKWLPYTQFLGVFDGCGHTISGICIDTTSQRTGFFASVKNATIKNVSFVNGYLYSAHNATNATAYQGFVSGHAEGANNYFENISVNAYQRCENNSKAVYVGHILGQCATFTTNTNFTNCVADGKIIVNEDASYVGGIYGGSTNAKSIIKMTNCVSYADINGGLNVAGLVGVNNGGSTTGYAEFVNCASLGVITTEVASAKKLTGQYIINGKYVGNDAYYAATVDTINNGTLNAGLKIEGVQQTAPADNMVDARFVASVKFAEGFDKDSIKKVGFEIASIVAFNADKVANLECAAVYEAIKYVDSSLEGGVGTITAEGKGADYLALAYVEGIPSDAAQTVVVRAYCELADGTVCYSAYDVYTLGGGAKLGGTTIG